VEELKWEICPVAKKVGGDSDDIWKLTNVSSKSVIVWGASHMGVCDGYSVSVLNTNRIVEPGQSIELLTRHRVRTINLEFTEYGSLQEAHTAYKKYLKNPEKGHGKVEHSFETGIKPVFPLQWCPIELDHLAEPVASNCHLSETYRPAKAVIEAIHEADRLSRRSVFRFGRE
jgi:hypothetical protein